MIELSFTPSLAKASSRRPNCTARPTGVGTGQRVYQISEIVFLIVMPRLLLAVAGFSKPASQCVCLFPSCAAKSKKFAPWTENGRPVRS